MGDSLISPMEAAEVPLARFATLPAVGPSMRLSGRMSGPRALDLEKEMATHSSIVAWGNPMDRGTGRATVHEVTKSRYN